MVQRIVSVSQLEFVERIVDVLVVKLVHVSQTGKVSQIQYLYKVVHIRVVVRRLVLQIQTLQDLRDRGNSVLVVEHDADTMRAADHLIELGPGAGVEGGKLIFEGEPEASYSDDSSRSGAFLSGRQRVEKLADPRRPTGEWLTVKEATENNLQSVTASFPVGLLTVVCGLSGSGKSTLVNDILAKAAALKFLPPPQTP